MSRIIYANEYCDASVNDIIISGENPSLISENENKECTATQWSSVDGGCIIPVNNTFNKLEAGYYSINFSNSIGMYFQKENIELNKLYRLPNEATETILNDIDKFWTLEETYQRYERVFKRNYLIYSSPGTGKTSLINIMCKDLIDKYNGIIFSLSCERDIEAFPEVMKRIRKIEPDRKVIAVIEDIDNFCYSHKNSSTLNTLLLNILDGNMKFGNLVVIATTNYIEQLEQRYVNRPSRFDRVIEFPLPNEMSRRIFICQTINENDINKINIEEWVKKTKGFTIDHINELILLHFVFGHTEEESFKIINKMVHENSNLTNTSTVNKKTLDFG